MGPRRRFLWAAAILGLSFSCGGGGGGGSNHAPTAVITFPPASSSTDRDSIVVTGTAFDPNGVAEVSVNGVVATT